MTRKNQLLSVVVPVYNEHEVLETFHKNLSQMLDHLSMNYEIIYVNDGSTDGTFQILETIAAAHKSVHILSLSRNFGKETAITAGMHEAGGDAVMTIDADGQHPVELIPKFVDQWQQGNKVVVGLRTSNQKEGPVKRYGSKIFYKLFNKITGVTLISGTTDFRLVDRTVQQEFARITERNRITRGLIDWLGYDRVYIHFKANPRLAGEAGYSFKKLCKLAVDSIISMSTSPLYVTAYIGAIILPLSILLGIGMFVNVLVGDPLHVHATGSAYIIVLILFLVGILLVSQAIIGLYLSHIHTETQNRPLYIIDKERSHIHHGK